MTDFRPMQSLPTGARFIGPDGRTEYRITRSAAEHEDGWVDVWNESMTDAEAQRRIAKGDVEDGYDPREGVFAYSHPVDVEVLS
jgi:hypothetical protein